LCTDSNWRESFALNIALDLLITQRRQQRQRQTASWKGKLIILLVLPWESNPPSPPFVAFCVGLQTKEGRRNFSYGVDKTQKPREFLFASGGRDKQTTKERID